MKLSVITQGISTVFTVGILLTCVFPIQAQADQAQVDWVSPYYRDHTLVGKIFSTRDQQWLTESKLIEQLKSKQLILLGESHTNTDHHIGQARIIEQWLKPAKPTALVFEMLAYDNWIDYTLPKLDLDSLTAKLEQIAGRWKWPLYQPILQLQIAHQLPMLGGNLTKQQLDAYSSGDACEVSRNNISLNACHALPEAQQQEVKQLIFDAHCGYLTMDDTQPMMHVQAAKDASFSLAMAEIADTHQVVLIAGAIHVRKDIGVPVHLQKLGYSIDQSIVSMAFLNVQEDKHQVEDYFEGSEADKQFDYVIFTPSERNQDPCEEFAEQLKKMKHLAK